MTKLHYASVVGTLSLASLIHAHASGQPNNLNDLSVRDSDVVPRPKLGSVPYGSIINNCAVPGAVALTYDDGPGPYTSELLDTLAASGVKATFFILGNRNGGSGPVDSAYPDLIKRMYREGHQIASHTWDHQSLESLNSAQRQAEMTKNEAAFSKILGFFPTYMRPPYGFCYAASGCLSDMGKLGYHVIDWSVDTKDFENDSPSLIQNAKNNWDAAFLTGNPKSSSFIPLTHDIHKNTVENLAPYMIAEIKQKGYKFMTVGECLNDPSSNWYRDATTGQTYVANKALAQLASSSSGSTNTTTPTTSSTRPSGTGNSTAVLTTASSVSATLSSSTRSASSSATSQASSNDSVRVTVNSFLYGILAMLLMVISV